MSIPYATMNHSSSTSGEIIGRLRKAYSLSQAALAQDLGISRQYLSEVENGRDPGMELLRAAAARFELPVAVFLMGEGNDDQDEITRLLHQVLDRVLTAAGKQAAAR